MFIIQLSFNLLMFCFVAQQTVDKHEVVGPPRTSVVVSHQNYTYCILCNLPWALNFQR